MKWVIPDSYFSILIIFHELGTFYFAKINGVEVEEFSIGFGPRFLVCKNPRNEIFLKLLLFGGSTQMKGHMKNLTRMMSFPTPRVRKKVL